MSRYRSEIVISLFLIMATLAVFWQVQDHEFINYDDNRYVTENRNIREGLSMEGVTWAFTTGLHGHWHPLTWLSHMMDCELFGLNPGLHHLSSLFLHIVNTLLLFFVLNLMTRAPLRSGFVAALFALHPLHVEPVTWLADRKDVLSAFFWLLTMVTYARYSEHPGFNRYLFVIIAFVLGLMAKSMVVTLPLVLLLMDYWPLRRFQFEQPDKMGNQQNHKLLNSRYKGRSALGLFTEKILLIFLVGASAYVTMLVMRSGPIGSIKTSTFSSLGSRISTSVVFYVEYIIKTVWPFELALPYPSPEIPAVSQALGAALLLICISFLVFWGGRRYPYLPVGWLWYLITLLPVIGLVRIGPHALADRYTYVPLIGLFIIIAWGVPDLVKGWSYRRTMLAISAGILLCGLMICAWLQVRLWKNSITLFTHTANVTSNNYRAHNNLAVALEAQGKISEAIIHYSESVRIKPNHVKSHNNLGLLLGRQGRAQEAIRHFYKTLRIRPDHMFAHHNLGVALARQGRLKEAIHHFSEAVRIKPDYAEAHNSLGAAFAAQGRFGEAIIHFSEALRIRPDYVKAKSNLDRCLRQTGNSPRETSK